MHVLRLEIINTAQAMGINSGWNSMVVDYVGGGNNFVSRSFDNMQVVGTLVAMDVPKTR